MDEQLNFYRVAKPSTYYWEFLSRWGKECYSSWRREILIALLLSLLIYAVSWSEKGAWQSTKDTLEGNLLLFLIFVTIHLVRVPYLLHHERAHPIEGGTPFVSRGFGVFGIALALMLVTSVAYGVVELWLGKAPMLAIAIETSSPDFSKLGNPEKEHGSQPDTRSAGPKGAPKSPTQAPVAQIPVQQQQPASQAAQPKVQSGPPAAPVTFLDRVVQENRGLTTDDRNRLSSQLFECNQFIQQGQAIGYKLNNEFGKLSNDRQSGALAMNVEEHIRVLQDINKSAMDQFYGLQKLQTKWQYFPDQTQYVLSDNPFNAGVSLLTGAAGGMAESLARWSKISNRDQQDILNIVSDEQNVYTKTLRQFFDWSNGCLQRLNQMRQSLDPNGVVQPIPTGAVAPATGMFTMTRD